MSAELPPLGSEEFLRRLAVCGVDRPSPELLERLLAHHEELRRWNRRLSLVGPGAAPEIVERHYAESLAALPLLPEGSARLIDVGSGAGFPGWILAAARPDLDVVLVEPRERKRLFLEAAARRAGISLRLSGARVGPTLPVDFPTGAAVLTVRALRLDSERLLALLGALTQEGRVLWWSAEPAPRLPQGLALRERRRLAGSRAILVLEPVGTDGPKP